MPESAHALSRLLAVTPSGLSELPISEEQAHGDLHTLMKGMPDGVYSALRTWGHDRLLWLDEHLARTVRSMRGLGWDYELDEAGLRHAIHEVVTAWPGENSRVRFDVLAASEPGLGTDSRLLLGISRFDPVPEPFLRDGVEVQVARGLERDAPRIKTTEFIERRQPYPLSLQDQYEHLLLDADENILEGSSSNFFAIHDGGIRTAGPGVLEGITRKVLLHIARAMGLALDERPVPLSEVDTLDEAFLTSSTRGVVPIVGVAGVRIGDGRPGVLTGRIMEAYNEFGRTQSRTAV